MQRELEERRSASDQELEQYKQKAALYQNKADAIAAELHATQVIAASTFIFRLTFLCMLCSDNV